MWRGIIRTMLPAWAPRELEKGGLLSCGHTCIIMHVICTFVCFCVDVNGVTACLGTHPVEG